MVSQRQQRRICFSNGHCIMSGGPPLRWHTLWGLMPPKTSPPPPRVTFRRVVVSLRGPGRSPGRCVLSAAAAGAPAGVVLGVVLVVVGVVLRVFAAPTPPSSGRPPSAPVRFRVREPHVKPPPPPPGASHVGLVLFHGKAVAEHNCGAGGRGGVATADEEAPENPPKRPTKRPSGPPKPQG